MSSERSGEGRILAEILSGKLVFGVPQDCRKGCFQKERQAVFGGKMTEDAVSGRGKKHVG